jgi:hypothetical protein
VAADKFVETYLDLVEQLNGFIPWAGKPNNYSIWEYITDPLLHLQLILSKPSLRCRTTCESLPMVKNSMLSCCHYGVMTSPETAQSSITSTSTFIWRIRTFQGVFFNKNTLFALYQHPHMLALLNNFRLCWTISSSYLRVLLLYCICILTNDQGNPNRSNMLFQGRHADYCPCDFASACSPCR